MVDSNCKQEILSESTHHCSIRPHNKIKRIGKARKIHESWQKTEKIMGHEDDKCTHHYWCP